MKKINKENIYYSIINNRHFKLFVLQLKKIKIPIFKISIFEFVFFLKEALTRSDINLKSTSLSFKFILSIFPILMLFLTIIPYTNISGLQDQILLYLYEIAPKKSHEIIKNTIEEIMSQKHSGLLTISTLFIVFYASEIISKLLKTLSKSNQIQIKHNPVKQRIISFFLMIFFSVFMIAGFIIIIFSEEALSYILKFTNLSSAIILLTRIIKWLLVFSLFVIAISTLYNFANIKKKKWKIFTNGGLLATIFIIFVSIGIDYYFIFFNTYNKLYGSIGTFIILLIWINLCSTFIILGYEFYVKYN